MKSTWAANNVADTIRLSFRRHFRQRRRQHGAADAIADGVDLVLAGRLFDCVERRKRPFADVVFEGLLASRSSGLTQDTQNTVIP